MNIGYAVLSQGPYNKLIQHCPNAFYYKISQNSTMVENIAPWYHGAYYMGLEITLHILCSSIDLSLWIDSDENKYIQPK
jgi:hypothetical protein